LLSEEDSCVCFLGFPPCAFCTGLNEQEADAFWRGGLAALKKMREAEKEASFWRHFDE